MSEIPAKMTAMKISSDVKHLGYGLLIGGTIAAITSIVALLTLSNETARALIQPEPINSVTPLPAFTSTAGILDTALPASTDAFMPTPTFTSTPTLIFATSALPSNIPSALPTLTPGEEKVLNGELSFTGSLTNEQHVQLYNTSINFIAATTEESIEIGEQFAGVGYGSPTLICGPLSIAILQTSGLLNFDVVPFDFWLLNPFVPKDRAILDRTFIPEKYEHHETVSSLREFDFSTFPLMTGDFLYVKHGWGGTFDHMLVVNRVDNMGRAYSVTNHNSAHGFIIDEVMLYDPRNPREGMFQTWTKKRNAMEGATGFGGFELWRLRKQ